MRNPYVFSQLVGFLDRNHFNYLVRKYNGDRYVETFTCWNQLLTLMFGQLSNRQSMRDLIAALEAHQSKCYHLGVSKRVTRSNLAKANEENQREFTYLTNAKHLTAQQIADLYKSRWQVELFFKWLKQHLRIKRFWGTSENTVRIQVYVAITTFCMVAIMQHKMKLIRSTYEILQILNLSLTDTTLLVDLLNKTNFQDVKDQSSSGELLLF